MGQFILATVFFAASMALLPVTTVFFQAALGSNASSVVPIFAAFSAQSTNLSVLVFEHGLSVAERDYEYLQGLASTGQIAVISSGAHDSTLVENTRELSDAMLAAWAWVWAQSKGNASFPLYGRLSGRAIAGGHSMGGGATFMSVAAQPDTFFSALTFAPCGYPNEVYPNLPKVHVPSMVLVGSKDCLCHDIPIHEFDGLNSSCKVILSSEAFPVLPPIKLKHLA